MNIPSLIHTDLLPVRHLHPAALGFAPGIDWTATLVLLGGFAVLIFAAGAVAAPVLGRRVPIRATPHPPPPPPGRPEDRSEFKILAAQRKALVGGSVKLRGLLEDQLLTNVLDDALRQGGVSVFEATGDPIDPARHRVAHTVPAPDPGADGVIAETLAPGYADDGRIVRPADVVVYRWGRS
jgi:GrpE